VSRETPARIRIGSLYMDLAASMSALRQDHPAVDRSREVVLRAMESGQAHYGINTGFGILANQRVDTGQLAQLQQNILLSHACGVGDPVPPAITRLMLQLKIHALGLSQAFPAAPSNNCWHSSSTTCCRGSPAVAV
jgi:histidine ammonia-lyase